MIEYYLLRAGLPTGVNSLVRECPRVPPNLSGIHCAPSKFELCLARLVLNRGGGNFEIIFPIGQGELARERAIGAKFDRLTSNRYRSARFGRALNDQFGIQIEPKGFEAWR